MERPVAKLENTAGKLKVTDVEKLVGTEVKTRGTSLDNDLKDAKAKAAAGEKDAAIKLYKNVASQKCMFPKKAKAAQAELKKLGSDEKLARSPMVRTSIQRLTAQIVSIMKRGLIAENKAQYFLADKLYTQARKLDLADPTPLRYLGELHRHHIGDWEKAKIEFHQILDMQSDPLSRAVALHGLGKITIHEGEFKKGLGLMEQSVDGLSARSCVSEHRGLLELGRRSRKRQRVYAEGFRSGSERSLQPCLRRRLYGSSGQDGRSSEDRNEERESATRVVQHRRDFCAGGSA
jgi:tetratricopeptide (TPR) repeat protein